MDLRTLLHAVRLHKVIFAFVVAFGFAAGVGYTAVRPPLLTTKALVIVSNTKHIGTQAVIAGSTPVLQAATKHLGFSAPVTTLQKQVQVTSIADSVLQITAEGKTADEARDLANAVAAAYEDYLLTHPGLAKHAVAGILRKQPPRSGRRCVPPPSRTRGSARWLACCSASSSRSRWAGPIASCASATISPGRSAFPCWPPFPSCTRRTRPAGQGCFRRTSQPSCMRGTCARRSGTSE